MDPSPGRAPPPHRASVQQGGESHPGKPASGHPSGDQAHEAGRYRPTRARRASLTWAWHLRNARLPLRSPPRCSSCPIGRLLRPARKSARLGTGPRPSHGRSGSTCQSAHRPRARRGCPGRVQRGPGQPAVGGRRNRSVAKKSQESGLDKERLLLSLIRDGARPEFDLRTLGGDVIKGAGGHL